MGATRYGQTALGRGFAAHPWRDAPTGGSQAVFSAALFFLRKEGTSVAVASSSARARLIADEDAPSHLCRKRAGSALGQLALQRLRLAPEHASGCPGQSAAWAVLMLAGRSGLTSDIASHHQPPAAIFSHARSNLSRTWLGLGLLGLGSGPGRG